MKTVLPIVVCVQLFATTVKAQIELIRNGNRRQDARHLLFDDEFQAFNKDLIRIEGFHFLQRREAREKRSIGTTYRGNEFEVAFSEGSGESAEDSLKQPFGKIVLLKAGADYQQLTTKQRAPVTTKPSSHPRLPSARIAADSDHEVLIENVFQKVARQKPDNLKQTTVFQTIAYSNAEVDSRLQSTEKPPLLIDEELELQEDNGNLQGSDEEAGRRNLATTDEDGTSGDWSFQDDRRIENSANDELFIGSIILNVMTAAPPNSEEDVSTDRKRSPKFNKDQLSSIPHGVAIQFLQTYCAAIVSAILAVTTIIVLCYIFYMYRQRSRTHKASPKAEKAVVVRRTCRKAEDSPSVLNVTSDAELLGLHDTSVFDSPDFVYLPQREAARSPPPPPPPLPRD